MHDSASLSGATANAGGTVTYSYYPTSSCSSGGQTVGSPVTVTNGNVPGSATVTFNTAGSYYWQAVYSGDSSNNGAASLCTSEKLTVSKKSPGISTSASSSVTVGSPISDVATLTGAFGTPAAGTVTFNVYAVMDSDNDGDIDHPDDDDFGCATPLNHSPLATVSTGLSGGNPTYTSSPFTPTNAGTYVWVATFAGDTNNNSVAGTCGASHETTTVNKATVAITTVPSGSVAVGGGVTDSASLTGAYHPTGNVTFTLYSNSGCSTQVFSSSNAISGTSATSGSWTTTAAGTYYWKASYPGDSNNASFTTPCGTGQETVVVTGSNTGQPYTISGTTSALLYPGAPAQKLNLAFNSSNAGNGGSGANGTRVSSLVVQIASITGGSNNPHTCVAADFKVVQYSGAYPFYIPFGASSLASLGFASTLWPTIQMLDQPYNQNGCAGATVHLTYTGTP